MTAYDTYHDFLTFKVTLWPSQWLYILTMNDLLALTTQCALTVTCVIFKISVCLLQ